MRRKLKQKRHNFKIIKNLKKKKWYFEADVDQGDANRRISVLIMCDIYSQSYRFIHFVISKVNVNKIRIKYLFFNDISFLFQSLNVDIMYETLLHLNDLHAEC